MRCSCLPLTIKSVISPDALRIPTEPSFVPRLAAISPLYDQNVHRAMIFIEDGSEEELEGYSDKEKIEFYLKRYLPFVQQFNGIDG